MNSLGLNSGTGQSGGFTGGVSVDNMTWWFWIKAGAGFAFGAGAVYVVSQIVWLWLVIKNPALVWLRWLVRF